MRQRTSVVHGVLLTALIAALPQVGAAQSLPATALAKMAPVAIARTAASGRSRVIVRLTGDASPSTTSLTVESIGGTVLKTLPMVNAQVIDLPNAALVALADHPKVEHISLDRRIVGAMERTGLTTGAAAVRTDLGYDGSGIGIAVIDSGVSGWHDDLAAAGGGQRVDRFVDFVNGALAVYDDHGHGTHVAGIIAGDGFDSDGARTGIAPGSRLVVLKVLDDEGRGFVSDVIAALEYTVAHRDALDIRVVNLSIATPVYESHHTDPLTLAAKASDLN